MKKIYSLLLTISLPMTSFAIHNCSNNEENVCTYTQNQAHNTTVLKQSVESNKPEEVNASSQTFGYIFKSLVTTLVKRIDALEEKVQKLEAQNSRLKEAKLVRESAKDSVADNKFMQA
ncbi:MAG TPA: hypothetical protein VFF04_04175 [Candidatus Babeliales bacterium]|nr:hypothetical protein [Candidatus Babeliales bacterium]